MKNITDFTLLPIDQALHLYHTASGKWRVIRFVFHPLPYLPEKFIREGNTLLEALASKERPLK